MSSLLPVVELFDTPQRLFNNYFREFILYPVRGIRNDYCFDIFKSRDSFHVACIIKLRICDQHG